MPAKARKPLITITLAYLLLILILTACNYTAQNPPPTPGEISPDVLTEVAATIQTQLTAAADLALPTKADTPTSPAPEAPNVTDEPPKAPIPTQSATPTATFTLPALPATATPAATNTAQPTRTKTPIPSPTTSPVIVYPTVVSTIPAYVVSSGEGFEVQNLNIPNCGVPWAVFQIKNTSGARLESLNLYMFNVTINQALYGPAISDTPFINSDRICQTGWIDQLENGAVLYVSGPLSGAQKGQSIKATLTLCTKENLTGSCYQKVVEFIVP
jgi:hypothetical protein